MKTKTAIFSGSFLFAALAGFLLGHLFRWPPAGSFLFGVMAGTAAMASVIRYFESRQNQRIQNLQAAIRKAVSGYHFRDRIGQKVEPIDRLEYMLEQMLQLRIRESESEKGRIAAILDNIAEGIMAVDGNGTILFANQAMGRIFGIRSEKAAGRRVLELTHQEKIEKLILDAMQRKETLSTEIEGVFPDEKVVRIQAIAAPEAQAPVRGILVFSDITDMRRLEKIRREFVANVSHELRTPLTSIKGFIETLLGGALRHPEQSETFLRMMEQDASRLTRLIDGLLELSRIESRRVPVRWEVFNLTEEVDRVVARCRPIAETGRVRIENKIQTPFSVYADRDKIQQVLLNLIENAVKFNRLEGSVRIDARAAGNKVEVTIEDTGIGIPKADIPRIFERFFRVDKARSRAQGGTGLGLSIVKHLLESHGETIHCRSTTGVGSSFTFSLAAAPSAKNPEPGKNSGAGRLPQS